MNLAEITAEHFPTPDLALRSNNREVQNRIRGFAEFHAAAARHIRNELLRKDWHTLIFTERLELLHAVYQHLKWWRYGIAAASIQPGSRHTAEHFIRPIDDTDTNYDRLGVVGRLRDGAKWDSYMRTFLGGQETPASRIIAKIGELALARFDREAADKEVLQNWVRLIPVALSNEYVRGNQLVRGDAARAVATELVERQRRRDNPVEGFDVGGELIYAATAGSANRIRLHRAALEILARADIVSLEMWCHAVYLLYQAPLQKKGSDALHRTFVVAVGAVMFDKPPRLAHDIDLRAMVVGQDVFVEYLLTINTLDVTE